MFTLLNRTDIYDRALAGLFLGLIFCLFQAQFKIVRFYYNHFCQFSNFLIFRFKNNALEFSITFSFHNSSYHGGFFTIQLFQGPRPHSQNDEREPYMTCVNILSSMCQANSSSRFLTHITAI